MILKIRQNIIELVTTRPGPKQAGSTGSLPQTPCSPATLEHQKRSVSVQQAKLKVQVNEDKDSMDKAVQDQDFLKAAGLKNSIAKAKLVQSINVFSVGLLT